MMRLLTCLKALFAPLVVCLSLVLFLATVWLMSLFVDLTHLGPRLKYVVGVVSPLVKELMWPLLTFSIACLFKDEIIAVLVEIKRLVSHVKKLDTAGLSLSFEEKCDGEEKVIKPSVPEPIPTMTFNPDEAAVAYCVKDAERSFGLFLQPNASLALAGAKMTLPWVDARGDQYKVLKVVRFSDYRKKVVCFIDELKRFCSGSQNMLEKFTVYIYIVCDSENGTDGVCASDFSSCGVQLFLKIVSQSECISK